MQFEVPAKVEKGELPARKGHKTTEGVGEKLSRHLRLKGK